MELDVFIVSFIFEEVWTRFGTTKGEDFLMELVKLSRLPFSPFVTSRTGLLLFSAEGPAEVTFSYTVEIVLLPAAGKAVPIMVITRVSRKLFFLFSLPLERAVDCFWKVSKWPLGSLSYWLSSTSRTRSRLKLLFLPTIVICVAPFVLPSW